MAIKKLSPQEIRAHKGVSFPGVTTVFFCHDGKGNLFLTKRSKKTRDEHGRWDVGGGGLKHGQAVEDNLRREVKEEYNVEPLKLTFLDYFDAFRKNADGQLTHWLAMVFVVLVDPTKVKINEPDMVDDHGWFSMDNLPSPLHSQFEPFMEKFKDKLMSAMQLDKAGQGEHQESPENS